MPFYILTYSELGTEFNTFSLSVNSGTIFPTTATRTQLLSGLLVQCNDGVTITVAATDGPCVSSQNIATPALPGPTYFYFSMQQCSGPGSITGRSITNYATGTVFNILGTCYTINTALGTSTISYDYNLDIYDEIAGGCSDPVCTGGGGSSNCDCYTVSVVGGGSITVEYTDCATETLTTGSFNNGDTVTAKEGTSATVIAGSGSITGPFSCII